MIREGHYQLLCLLDLGALETDDERNLHLEVLGSSNDTLGNDVAAHDTAKDVDECRGDVGVGCDDLKGSLHGLGRS